MVDCAFLIMLMVILITMIGVLVWWFGDVK